MKMHGQIIDLPSGYKKQDADAPVEYTADSLKRTVIAVAMLLNRFADDKHPAVNDPTIQRRRMANTAVFVQPRVNGHINRVGFQLFVNKPDHDGGTIQKSDMVSVVFDMRSYEKHKDLYLYNMLNEIAQKIRESHRPSREQLKVLSTRFMLEN